jgi:hypothetical protein
MEPPGTVKLEEAGGEGVCEMKAIPQGRNFGGEKMVEGDWRAV